MPESASRRILFALWSMAAISLAVRLHNVAEFPGLRAPDGMGHFTYIWHLASTGTIPLATQGWSFFHPPLYYAWMAWVWNTFDVLDASVRLKLGTAVIATASLSHAAVAWTLVSRRFPANPVLALSAAGFLLFLPLQLFTASYIGNEGLYAVLASLVVLATIRFLDASTTIRALTLGLLLGAAMLTKFTALAFVAGAFTSIALALLAGRRGSRAARVLPLAALAGAVALACCGWFYLRNIEVYGNPFQMSRDTLDVRRIENIQSIGRRNPAEFLLFDPVVVVRPQWPRGIPITMEAPYEQIHDAVRESVWTGLFTNTFFDGPGGQVLPLVTVDEQARRSGQILLALGLLPTALVLVGFLAALGRLARSGWDDTDGPAVVFFVASMSLFAYGVTSVPMHAAVKATYLLSTSCLFAYWLASGLHLLSHRLPPLYSASLVNCAALAVASVVVFTQGALVSRDFVAKTWRGNSWQNLSGFVAYAGGDFAAARHHFERAASGGFHLAQENLAAMARDDGQDLEDLYRMRLASLLQRDAGIGRPADRELHDRRTQAEYRNSIGAAYYQLGWIDEAESSLRESLALEPSIPETSYNLGIVALTRMLDTNDELERKKLDHDARHSFARAVQLDPGFAAAQTLASRGDRDAGRCTSSPSLPARRCWTSARAYPVETASGDLHASAVQRRRHITRLRSDLHAALAELDCVPENSAQRGRSRLR
ncbi:MAG: hypothetical protein ABR587_10815 [Candidatus Binatia bacterium]